MNPLTFEQLRGNCIRRLQEIAAIYGGGSFSNPDKDFLFEENSAIAVDLRFKGIDYDPSDFCDAYWSAVFQLEHKQNIYPGCTIWWCEHKSKILRFRHKYPIEADIQVFSKNGKPRRAKYSARLTEPVIFYPDWHQLSLFEE